MRSFAYILAILFASAVIAPNDIGTHELPATGTKALNKAPGHNWHQHVGKGTAALLKLDPIEELPGMVSDVLVYKSVQTICNSQLSSPLLI